MTTTTTHLPALGLLVGKVVLITGASRGIGADAARLFTREGAAVVLVARPTDALDRIVTEIRTNAAPPTPSPWTSPIARASAPRSTTSPPCTAASTVRSTTVA